MIRAEFSGGPFGGSELIFVGAGAPPGYVLLMSHPTDSNFGPIIVGADFNDGWSGQHRYQLHSIFDADATMPTAIYEHADEPS